MVKETKIILKVPAGIEKVMTMADGGLRLFVDTQELLPEDKGAVMAMHKKIGTFVFVEGVADIAQEDLIDLPKFKIDEGETKTPSERLRAALYIYWEQYKPQDQFDPFYRSQMEKFINSVKAKLH